MEEQKSRLKRDIAKRIGWVYYFFVVVVLYFAGRLAYVQLSPTIGAHLDTMLCTYIIKPEMVEAHRGSIYSRDGKTLATSITRKELHIGFGSQRFDDFDAYRADAEALSKRLADYFGDRSAKEYYDDLIRYQRSAVSYATKVDTIEPPIYKFWEKERVVKREYVARRRYISRKLFRDIDLNEWEEIRQFPLLKRGLNITYNTYDKDYRVYPQGEIALRTIGRNEAESGRRYGIEYALDDTLAGHNGLQYMQQIASGKRTRIAHRDNIESQNGYDIVTTLDVDVQDVADKALRDQIVAQNAEWGTTVVMECATGDILAIANIGRGKSRELYERQNYAIGVPVNPGSTFKLVSTMALLERGVPTSRRYNSELGKRVKVGGNVGAWVQDSHPISRETKGVIDMRTAFAESANVYFTKAVFDTFRDSTELFSNFCRKLHLHETVGLEYLGARAGVVPHLSRRHHSRYNALVNMAYGYNMDITPLHTLAIYNAVANGGRMVAPRLILRIERDGKCVKECEPRIIEEQICSKSTLDTLRSFMEEVSLSGTAAEYFGEKRCSFRTGAKTGTAQVNSTINGVKYNRGDGYYYGSMVTYLPADNPRYTIITAIFTKQQRGKFYYGASLTGPVQQRVATFLHNRDKEYAEQLTSEKHYVRQIKGGSVKAMREVAGECAERYSSSSRSGWGRCRADEEQGIVISATEPLSDRVPDVMGMGLSDALYLLERCGLSVDIEGAGSVVRQSIAAGGVANRGDRIKIELE